MSTRPAWGLAVLVGLTSACGGDGGTGPARWSPSGSWRAAKWEFVEIAAPSNRYDVVENGAVMRLVFAKPPGVTMTLSWMGVNLSEPGTWTFSDGVLTIALEEETMRFTVTTDQRQLELVETDAGFDFDHDGQDEPAHVNGTMVRE